MAELIDGRGSGVKDNPDYRILFEPSPRRVRVAFNGATIADSTRAHLLFETRHLPVYYFPREDVRMELLAPTAHHTFCPYKGKASYWTIRVGDQASENAVWGYLDPYDEVAAIRDFVAFYWDRVDHWYEEDEEIFVHPRDPINPDSPYAWVRKGYGLPVVAPWQRVSSAIARYRQPKRCVPIR